VAISAHRKVVTVLFCDVVDSTALGDSTDPEALQRLLARYFERMKEIVESHGGSVEKFIGDAVMAVFGVPVAHEDDALRACRAATEMRDALPELGVKGRIGVNTGEVLAGTEERLATGDAINVAARLQQAAQPGQVLIGSQTHELVGPAVEAGEERLLELKGKSEPIRAYPLVEILKPVERSHASRFVGRERELEQLVDAWDRALARPGCELLTVVGDPGVGKSRLVAEAVGRIDARVVRGRCLSYGEGITYWPVVEVVKQLDALPSDDFAARAIRSLSEDDSATGTDEIAWAFRKLLEAQAPLVVCFDDIQWGEETFLDLVESIALLSTGAPLLLMCMARPELLDRRPRWPATLRLEPLLEEEAGALVGDAVPDLVRERIVRASGGNPLFLTEMVALAGDGAEVEVPATLRALLVARLDQLEESERRVLERGAVEGELFHRGTVQALAPEETEVTPRLAALVRRDLVRPDQSQLPREDAYRFRHLLIRDAAYDALPKSTRADLHRRFAAWLEEHGRSLVEFDEVLGYHLEQAALYLDELGQSDPEVAIAAGDRLALAGRRAYSRGDLAAASSLLERSLGLTRAHRFDVHLELTFAEVLRQTDLARAIAVADGAAERAASIGEEAGAALARTMAADAQARGGMESSTELERRAREALPLLEVAGDHDGLAMVWRSLGLVANVRCRTEDWARACEQALLYARPAQRGEFGASLGVALCIGPRPADEALARLERLAGESPHPVALVARATLLAMLNRFEEARALALPARERGREFGLDDPDIFFAEIALIEGDWETSASSLQRACELQEASGNTGHLSTYAPRLGNVLCTLGRYEEAEQLALTGRELGPPDDVLTQQEWRRTLALVRSAQGEHAEAEQLAREAVQFALQTDSPLYQGNAFCDLATVLEAAGRRDEAIASLHQALECYERKPIIPLARRVRERLAALQETAM
jgi:class 3 adenylate cyclase/tetratricopeptide (TPR) repeat protein